MDYLLWVTNSTNRDHAATLNAEVQELVTRYGPCPPQFDWRADGFDHTVHCSWFVPNGGRSPCVRFDDDLNVQTFGDDSKEYNLLNQNDFEQLIFDVVDTLAPGWG